MHVLNSPVMHIRKISFLPALQQSASFPVLEFQSVFSLLKCIAQVFASISTQQVFGSVMSCTYECQMFPVNYMNFILENFVLNTPATFLFYWVG